MTSISLSFPKEQICFACHERSAALPRHVASKKICIDCHDAHSSKQRMLLLDAELALPSKQ